MPFISIVIPTYNHARFLFKALQSVMNQTYQNWEAIVIDNNSKDETNRVISEFRDPRIKFFKIVNNGVIAKSRNLGIRSAQGEWIAFLDSDDWWTSDKLQICLSQIDENVDLLYHDLIIEHEKSKFIFNRKKYQGYKLNKPILNDLLIGGITFGNAIGNSSVIVRRNILNKIGRISENKNLVGSEDYNTWLRIAQITNKFKYLKKKLGYNLIHDGSVSKKDMSISQREAVADFMNLLSNQQKLNLEVKLRYIQASHNYLNNNNNEAKKNFLFLLRNGFINLRLRSLLKIVLIKLKVIWLK